MKSIKYLVAALLVGSIFTSCGEPAGTVGQTTVQFDAAEMESSFGAEYVKVPITIFGANADAMNTADVNVKVKIDETYTGSSEGVYVAKEDITGKPEDGGDIRVTSYDLVFRNNYDIADEDKKKPFDKTIYVEVLLLNKAPEIMEFKVVIESSNTTIGDIKECVVRLEKGATDRLCGTYTVTDNGGSPFSVDDPNFTTTISWNVEYNCFEILPFVDWTYAPIMAYFDEETEEMYMLPYEPIMWYDQAAMQMCFSMFFSVSGSSIAVAKDQRIVLDYDIEKGTIKFPMNYNFGVLVFTCDEGYNPQSLVGYFTGCDSGFVFTKKK